MPTDQTPQAPLSKQEAILKISQALLERRLLRGLTYEKISQSTKIRVSFLKALEEGDWVQLPGDVYIRGFVSRYAQFLGLKPEDLLAPYIQVTAAAPRKTLGLKTDVKVKKISKSVYVWSGVGSLVFIALIKMVRMDHREIASSAIESKGSVSRIEKSTVSTKTVVAAQPLVAHRVDIYSPLPLWLSVKASDRNFEGFISQNSTWTFKGNGSFLVHLGHTQEIALYFDGRPIPLDENQKKFTLPSEN